MKLNNKGQGVIEFVVVFPTLILFFVGVTLSILLFSAVHFIQFIAEEALYCSFTEPTTTCEAEGKHKILQLPGIEISDLRISATGHDRELDLKWNLNPGLFRNFKVGQDVHLKSNIEIFDEK